MVFGWGKKKEIPEVHEVVNKTIVLSDVVNILDSIKKEESHHLIEQTKKLQFPISHHIESLLKIAIQLEKDKLNTDDIDINIVTIVKRGKKQVLDIIHKESEREFPELNSVDDVKLFNRQSSQTLTRIGDILGKQTRVIHIFAKKYAGKLKGILEKYTEDNDHSTRLLEKYVGFEQKHNQIIEIMDKLKTESNLIQTDTEKISSLNNNISKFSQKINELEEKISQYKSSENYKQSLIIKKDLNSLIPKKSEIEREINNQTILISRPISKYEYGSSLDKENRVLIEKFTSLPFEVFLSTNRSDLNTILENIKKAISLGHMSVKEPEKTVTYIDDIVSKIDGFILKIESFRKEEQELNEQLKNLDLQILDDHQKQLSKTQDDIDFSKSRIQELDNEKNQLISNKSDHIQKIESLLNLHGATKYVIQE